MSSPSADLVRVSVTEVTTSLLCPRLFWFGRAEGRSTLLGQDLGRGIGRLVHEVIAAFEEAAPNPADLQVLLRTRSRARRALVRERLVELLYQDFVLPRLKVDAETGRGDGDRWLAVVQALERYAEALSEVLVRNAGALAPDQVIGRTLVGSELALEAPVELAAGRLVLVGRVDSVWAQHDPERVLLCEWKTRAASGEGDDALQLALYARLLEAARGVVAHGMVVALDSEDPGTAVRPPRLLRRTWERSGLDEHLGELVGWTSWRPGRGEPPPGPESRHLCGVCPQRVDCHRRFGEPEWRGGREPASVPEPPSVAVPRAAAAPRRAPETAARAPRRAQGPGPERASPPDPALYERILEAFAEYKVAVERPTGEAFTEGPSVYLARVLPGRGVVPRDIEKLAEALKMRLGLPGEHRVRSWVDRGAVVLEVPKADEQRRWVPAAELWAEAAWDPDRLAVPVGRDVANQLVEVDFSSADSPHLLIAGMTGQGKSVALKVLLEGLCRHRSADELRLFLVDPKRVELASFGEYPHVTDPAVHSPEEAIALLERAVEQMEARYDLFAAAGVVDLPRYNAGAQPGDRLPRWLVVLDEYADLVVDKNDKKAIEALLGRLSQKARAAGIHLVVATQRPEAKILSPTVRSNLGAQLALRVRDGTDSRMILGETGAEALIGKGDALLRTAQGVVRVQCGVG